VPPKQQYGRFRFCVRGGKPWAEDGGSPVGGSSDNLVRPAQSQQIKIANVGNRFVMLILYGVYPSVTRIQLFDISTKNVPVGEGDGSEIEVGPRFKCRDLVQDVTVTVVDAKIVVVFARKHWVGSLQYL
jgi:hypothetical protein